MALHFNRGTYYSVGLIAATVAASAVVIMFNPLQHLHTGHSTPPAAAARSPAHSPAPAHSTPPQHAAVPPATGSSGNGGIASPGLAGSFPLGSSAGTGPGGGSSSSAPAALAGGYGSSGDGSGSSGSGGTGSGGGGSSGGSGSGGGSSGGSGGQPSPPPGSSQPACTISANVTGIVSACVNVGK